MCAIYGLALTSGVAVRIAVTIIIWVAVSTAEGGPTDVAVVHSCRRDGRGGSPTAVVCRSDAPPDLPSLCRLPARVGASHAVVVDGPPEGPVDLRFFTATGELPACGHGTVAALAF